MKALMTPDGQFGHLRETIVKLSEYAVISIDLDDVITGWNPGAERLFGYTEEEIIGKPITLLFPPDRIEEAAQILARLTGGERVDHYEAVRVAKDGRHLTEVRRHGSLVA